MVAWSKQNFATVKWGKETNRQTKKTQKRNFKKYDITNFSENLITFFALVLLDDCLHLISDVDCFSIILAIISVQISTL